MRCFCVAAKAKKGKRLDSSTAPATVYRDEIFNTHWIIDPGRGRE